MASPKVLIYLVVEHHNVQNKGKSFKKIPLRPWKDSAFSTSHVSFRLKVVLLLKGLKSHFSSEGWKQTYLAGIFYPAQGIRKVML